MGRYVNNIDSLQEIMGYKFVTVNHKVLYGENPYDGYISYKNETLYFMIHHDEGNKSIYIVYRKDVPL
jgi:hypothetical protein